MPEAETHSVTELLKYGTGELGASTTPRLDTELFLAEVLTSDRAALITNADQRLTLAQEARFRQFIAKRRGGVPVAYLLGRKEFWSLNLQVTKHTLIPRPETELLVEQALEIIRREDIRTIADLGTGSGCVALAVAHECPDARVVGVDISEQAIAVATRNAVRLAIPNVQFVSGDWYNAFGSVRFELIAANPPYVASNDPQLASGDIRHEPVSALASGQDGLDATRKIIAGASNHLRQGGWMMLEHGENQGPAVCGLLAKQQFETITTFDDLSGRARVTIATRAG